MVGLALHFGRWAFVTCEDVKGMKSAMGMEEARALFVNWKANSTFFRTRYRYFELLSVA